DGNADGVRRSSTQDSMFSGDRTLPRALFLSSNFWFVASCDAKFIRDSIAPLVNHACPRSQPATSGGSNSCCPMAIYVFKVSFTENPAHPISLMARTTYSAGHE